MAPAVEERSLEVRGILVRCLESGQGEPAFVLVHGLGSSATKWRDVLPLIGARGRRAIAPDMPGFGRSEAPRARYSIGWLAGAVRETMDAAGIGSAHVVGNSLGGMVGLWLASVWPERVRSLSLVAAALPTVAGQRHDPKVLARFAAPLVPGLGEALYAAFTRMKTPEEIVDDSLDVNVADRSRVSPETIRLLVEEAAERRHRPELRRAMLSAQRSLAWTMAAERERVRRIANGIGVPTLLVWGNEDRMIPLAVGEHWVGEIPGAELVVLDGAGHNPQLEVPEELAGVILAFAEKAERTAP